MSGRVCAMAVVSDYGFRAEDLRQARYIYLYVYI